MPWLPKRYRESWQWLPQSQILSALTWNEGDKMMASAPLSQFLDTVISTVVETHTSKLTGAKKDRMSECAIAESGTKRYEKQCVRKRVPGYLGT
jgi:hypothetical protein